jgi:hypothetical protein
MLALISPLSLMLKNGRLPIMAKKPVPGCPKVSRKSGLVISPGKSVSFHYAMKCLSLHKLTAENPLIITEPTMGKKALAIV